MRRLERSWIGLNLDALRLDETAASCFGLDIARWKITAFLLGNFLIGIAGALFGMVGGFVAPNNYTFADSLILVSILLLGGIGNPWGLVVATIIVVVVPEKLQTIQEYRFLLYAALVIAGAAVPAGRPAAAAGAPLFSGVAAVSPSCSKPSGLTSRFGGVVALDRLDLECEPNEILGLIGPNGSGKTTFFNVVTGIYGADGGSVTFDGADITGASPQRGLPRRDFPHLPALAAVAAAVDLRQHHDRQSQAAEPGTLVQSDPARRLQARVRAELRGGSRAARRASSRSSPIACSSQSPACR